MQKQPKEPRQTWASPWQTDDDYHITIEDQDGDVLMQWHTPNLAEAQARSRAILNREWTQIRNDGPAYTPTIRAVIDSEKLTATLVYESTQIE
jgi:hypothetical protein